MRVSLNALEVFPLDIQLLLAIGSYFQAATGWIWLRVPSIRRSNLARPITLPGIFAICPTWQSRACVLPFNCRTRTRKPAASWKTP